MKLPSTPLAWALPALLLACSAAHAQITVYEHDNFQGRSVTAQGELRDLRQRGFNDRGSSAVVGGSRHWEICDDVDFGGTCRLLRPGQYPSLSAMGLNDRVSSLRAIGSERMRADPNRYAPAPAVSQDFRRRGGERLFEAPVQWSRAVYGPAEQRCWIEREAVRDSRNDNRVPGALIGAVIGGILGHQVGGGSGRDLATVGGVVAGGVVGSNVGRGRDDGGSREVQRCADAERSATPVYWEVSYTFRNVAHRVQMTSDPGRSVTVNRRGEPRA